MRLARVDKLEFHTDALTALPAGSRTDGLMLLPADE